MTLQDKAKADIIIATIISFSFIAFLGFLLIFAKDEGTIGDVLIVNFIADYIIYVFPFVLLGRFQVFSFDILALLTGINILFYSFLLARLFSKKLLDTRGYQPFTLTIVVICGILLVALIYFILLIATKK